MGTWGVTGAVVVLPGASLVPVLWAGGRVVRPSQVTPGSR